MNRAEVITSSILVIMVNIEEGGQVLADTHTHRTLKRTCALATTHTNAHTRRHAHIHTLIIFRLTQRGAPTLPQRCCAIDYSDVRCTMK